jgi:hypothetical protein
MFVVLCPLSLNTVRIRCSFGPGGGGSSGRRPAAAAIAPSSPNSLPTKLSKHPAMLVVTTRVSSESPGCIIRRCFNKHVILFALHVSMCVHTSVGELSSDFSDTAVARATATLHELENLCDTCEGSRLTSQPAPHGPLSSTCRLAN